MTQTSALGVVLQLDALVGEWVPVSLVAPHMVVEGALDFLSGDQVPLTFRAGAMGVVQSFDSDCDAFVSFPCMAASGLRTRLCVFKEDIAKCKLKHYRG